MNRREGDDPLMARGYPDHDHDHDHETRLDTAWIPPGYRLSVVRLLPNPTVFTPMHMNEHQHEECTERG
ncbi:MAG: hypothetical protein ABGY24_16650, partial [bacterium]